MATRIRLRKVGRKKHQSYRIIVAGQIHPRDGRNSETIGKYNPRTQPSSIEIDEARAIHWLRQGAQPSDSVRSIFRRAGILKKLADGAEGEGVAVIGDVNAKTIIGVEPKKPSKKAVAKAAKATEEAESPAAAPEAEAAAEAPEAEAAAEAPEAEAAEEAPEAEAAAEAPEAEAPAEAPEAEAAADAPEAEATEAPEAEAEEAAEPAEEEKKES